MVKKEVISRICSEIKHFAQEENALLQREFGKSIFDMPELAFVYEIGKRIARRRSLILGSEDYEWLRETNVGAGGITDLIFQPKYEKSLPTILIEFKMDDTYHSYAKDIEKLMMHPNSYNTIKLFVGLKWLFEETENSFLSHMQREISFSGSLVEPFSFPVQMQGQKSSICYLTIWEVDDRKHGDDGFDVQYESQEQIYVAAYHSYLSLRRNCEYSHEQALYHIGYSHEEFEKIRRQFEPTDEMMDDDL